MRQQAHADGQPDQSGEASTSSAKSADCRPPPTSWEPLRLDGTDVRGLRAFRALGSAELHPLTFVERTEAGRLNSAVVHEHVSTSAIDGDEAEALLRVEPFNGTLR